MLFPPDDVTEMSTAALPAARSGKRERNLRMTMAPMRTADWLVERKL